MPTPPPEDKFTADVNPEVASFFAKPQPYTVASLIEEATLNPVHWLIPGILLEGGQHILHDKEECFKTMLTLQLHEALALGGEFLGRQISGGLVTGIVQLETKHRLFGNRLKNFFRGELPPIHVFPADRRLKVLNAKLPKERIGYIVEWAKTWSLQVISIDSAVKLFPAGCDVSKPEQASEVFSQLQLLPTTWMLAHDRKSQDGEAKSGGNDEIVGSGRFAQDPDIVHQMVREDKREPRVVFQWGKVRDGEKHGPLELWFDKIDFRLRAIHPYIHLLRRAPTLECDLVSEAQARYGWHERRARDHIASLRALKTGEGGIAVTETQQGHRKLWTLTGEPVPQDPDGPP